MNEKELANWILMKVKTDNHLTDLYSEFIDGKSLDQTVEILRHISFLPKVTFEDVIILSLFIGITNEQELIK